MNIFKKLVRKGMRILQSPKDSRKELLESMPKNSICAEIGVWKGDFSSRIMEHISPSKLHLIDPWKYQTSFGERLYGGKVAQNQADMDTIYKQVVDKLSPNDSIEIHRAFSNVAYSTFADEYFDWIYVDGNHYYEYVIQDLENFAPKIKKNGFLTGDDYMWSSPELNGDKPIFRAVKDFLNRNKNFTLYKVIEDQFILRKYG